MNVRTYSLIAVLVLLMMAGAGVAFSQASFTVPFTFTHASEKPVEATIGYHPDATYCVDEALGEFSPPPPPPGFDVAFGGDRPEGNCPGDLSIGEGMQLNLHKMPPDQTVMNDTFKIVIKGASQGPTTTISWPSDFATNWAYRKITVAVIKDAITGTLVNQDLKLASSVTFNSAFTVLYLYLTITNGIEQTSDVVPASFALEQNYPNPFNPTTSVRFSIEKTAMAEIAVYDLLGRKVATLANEELNPGVYTTTWNGADEQGRTVASGVYHLRMLAHYTNAAGAEESFSQLRKIILMK